jgi:hypothetical protein
LAVVEAFQISSAMVNSQCGQLASTVIRSSFTLTICTLTNIVASVPTNIQIVVYLFLEWFLEVLRNIYGFCIHGIMRYITFFKILHNWIDFNRVRLMRDVYCIFICVFI